MQRIVLQCEGLRRTYQQGNVGLTVLDGVELSVAAGELVAIMGSSGAGKSTLMHLLGGLDVPDRGEVRIAGTRLDQVSDAKRGLLRNRFLGFVYQFHHLLPEFSALENVAMPLLIRGDSIASVRRAAADMLKRVGLEARLDHRPAQLSGGERQRAAVARALVTEPACVLADEPTGNLDRQNADRVLALMLDLNRERQSSLVIVTHDHDIAGKMDRVLVLKDGGLQPMMAN